MPSRGTTTRQLRVDDELWAAFGAAVTQVDVEADRSGVLRNFIRWYVGQPNATLPERPKQPSNTDTFMRALVAEQDENR